MAITRIPFFHFYRANKRVAAFAANLRPEKLAQLRAEIAAHKAAAQPQQQPQQQQQQRGANTPQLAVLEA
jgi:hypothetical protein